MCGKSTQAQKITTGINHYPENYLVKLLLMRFTISIAFIFCLNIIKAQTIIANGSFEDINVCDEYSAVCSPAAWFFVAQKLTRGYMTDNDMPGSSGKKYLNIDLAKPDRPSRQYWETMLLCKLRPGVKYLASMQITTEDSKIPDPSILQFYFADSFIYSQEDTLLSPENYLSFSDAKIKYLKYNWVEVKKEFIADKDYQFLIIGNFSKTSNKELLQHKNYKRKYSFLVDNLSIVALDKSICTNYGFIRDSLYSITQRHRLQTPAEETYDTSGLVSQIKIDTLILNNILFDFNDYSIRNKEILDQYKTQFDGDGIEKILIVGFADDTGTKEYNLKLSNKRAQEVESLISQKFNIPPSIISTEGRGISKEFSQQFKNRRVEIFIYHR